jgi:hypothetical protein
MTDVVLGFCGVAVVLGVNVDGRAGGAPDGRAGGVFEGNTGRAPEGRAGGADEGRAGGARVGSAGGARVEFIMFLDRVRERVGLKRRGGGADGSAGGLSTGTTDDGGAPPVGLRVPSATLRQF